MTYQEMYDMYTNMSNQERIKRARDAVNAIYRYCDAEGFSKEETVGFVCSIIKLAVTADQFLANAEHSFFQSIFGSRITFDEMYATFNTSSQRGWGDKMDRFIDGLPEDTKTAVLILVLCFMSTDGEVSDDEHSIFARLLN